MTDLIIAFDNDDTSLGVFFNRCAQMIIEAASNLNSTWNCISINSRSLNEVHLEVRIGQLAGNFVFASFTHGSETSLLASGSAFIQSPIQRNCLANSFSYCFACHSGKSLGLDLVANGTHSFIGYSEKVDFVIGYIQVFSECATSGLIGFINGETIKQCLAKKKIKYTEQIDNLYKDHFFAASVLMDNRDCLVLHGNGELRNTDFSN